MAHRAGSVVLIVVGMLTGGIVAGGGGGCAEDPTLATEAQALTWDQCAAGGGIDYTGNWIHNGVECRGACGGGCDSDACSDWSPCTNGTQFRTCYTMPFCQQHDKCYDCCRDNGYSILPGSQCALACDYNCLYQYHPPCRPQICTWVCDSYYGSGSGSNSSPTCVSYHQECHKDPADPANCGLQYTSTECAQLAGGYTNSFPEATMMQFNRSCTSCIPDGSCSAPPCGVGVDNCGNGCAHTYGCTGSGSNTY